MFYSLTEFKHISEYLLNYFQVNINGGTRFPRAKPAA